MIRLKSTSKKARSARRRATRVMTLCLTVAAALAVVVGVVLAIGHGSQQTARGLILFGSIVFAACVAPWLERRWGDGP